MITKHFTILRIEICTIIIFIIKHWQFYGEHTRQLRSITKIIQLIDRAAVGHIFCTSIQYDHGVGNSPAGTVRNRLKVRPLPKAHTPHISRKRYKGHSRSLYTRRIFQYFIVHASPSISSARSVLSRPRRRTFDADRIISGSILSVQSCL